MPHQHDYYYYYCYCYYYYYYHYYYHTHKVSLARVLIIVPLSCSLGRSPLVSSSAPCCEIDARLQQKIDGQLTS